MRFLLTPILLFFVWTNHGQIKRIPLDFDAIHPRVNSITQDHKNFIYFGTSNGLYYYTGDNLEQTLGAKDLQDIRITAVIHPDSTHVIVGTRAGLYSYNATNNKIEQSWLGNQEITILKKLNNSLLIGTKSLDLYKIKQDSIESFNLELPLNPKLFNLTQIIELSNKEFLVWIAAIDGSSSYQYNTKTKLLESWSNPLLKTYSQDGDIINLGNYLRYINDENIDYKWTHNLDLGPENLAKITAIHFYSPTEIWMGTNDGVLKFDHQLFGVKILGDGKIRGISQLKDSTILALSTAEILKIKNQKIVKNIPWPKKFQKRPYSIFPLNEATTLIGSDGRGIYKLTEELDLEPYPLFDSLKNAEILDIKQINNQFWIATQKGLSVVSENEFMELDLSNRVYDILPFDQGALIGGKTGLYYACIKNGKILGIKLNKENFKIRALQNYNENIFIATEENGIVSYNPNTEMFNRLGINEGLNKETVYNIVIRDNYLFAGAHDGLLAYNLDTKEFMKTYKSDGLSDSEFNSNSDLIDFNGTLYLGTQKGITIIEKNEFLQKKDPFKIYLDQVSYLDSDQTSHILEITDEQLDFKFPAESHMIKFNLKINDLHHPESNMLFYKFEGDQSSALIEDTDLLLPYLPARKYELTIKALNHRRQWSENQLKINIEIKPVFYKSWRFFTLIIMILCIFFISIIFLNKRHQKIILSTRNAFATDLHDEMGGDLTAIKYKVELLKDHIPQEEIKELDTIAEILQNTQINISDLIWSLKPKEITVGLLFDRIEKILERRLSRGDLKYNFQYSELGLDESIHPDIKQNLYLIFKEALSNFIKHSDYDTFNIAFKPFKKGVEVSMHQSGKKLNKARSKSFGSYGIKNMKHRAASINGIILFDKTSNWNISLKIPKL
ncbi:histidine kinase [Flavobacteriaceae bacterium]|nr:histidine kinase [Flavobacteriaceae bacterium]